MKKKLTITAAEKAQNELALKTDEAIEGLSPTGRMLVDSDNLAFVYLMEYKGEYAYIMLPDRIWPELKEAMDRNTPVHLVTGNVRFELAGLGEELSYLTENIKGNGNYGEAMVAKVESIF